MFGIKIALLFINSIPNCKSTSLFVIRLYPYFDTSLEKVGLGVVLTMVAPQPRLGTIVIMTLEIDDLNTIAIIIIIAIPPGYCS